MSKPVAHGIAEDSLAVLLVDDESAIVNALKRELRQTSFVISSFTDPRQAQEALKEREYALIIADNMMPNLTGLELLAGVKSDQPMTRRLLLTGRTHLEEAVRAFNDGSIHRFVNKPWERDELMAIVQEEIEAYRQATQDRRSKGEAISIAKKRTAQLQKTVDELKQAHTQLALIEESADASKFHLSRKLRSASILVVEEHDGVRKHLVTNLKQAGILECRGAKGGHKALEYLHASPVVDVVLSEWKMNEMDGMTLFQALRTGQTQSANALFILVTTLENREAVESAIKAGINGYVIKPFRMKQLLKQVENRLPRTSNEYFQARIKELYSLSYLVANTDIDSRFETQNILVRNGLKNVTMADSGQKSLRIIMDKKIDTLIYDCNLRDPYWIDLTDSLIELNCEHMPSIVVTSVTPMQKEFEEVNRMGLDSFLPGSVTRSKLLHAIIRAKDRQASLHDT